MRFLFSCILFSLVCLRASAQLITLSDAAASYSVDYPFYLEDKEAAYTLEEVKDKREQFLKASDKVPDFLGNTSKAIWYRFDVANNSDNNEWFLEIKGGFMHRVTVYQTDSNGTVQSLTLEADHHSSERPIRSNNIIYPVPLAKGARTTIYVRSTTKTLIRTSMRFVTMQSLYEQSIFVSYADGFFTAIAVALLLYNLYVYFTLREKVYLYYIGYISTAILHTNLVSGHAQAFTPWLDWLNSTTILPIVSFFSILFTNSFLQTRQYARLIFKLRWIMIACCIVPLLLYVAGSYAIAILIISILVFTLFAYWLTAGVTAYRNGFQPALFYIIGFGALAAMSVIFELKMKGVLEESYWTDSSLFIGAAIEAVVLSFALASKINFYKKEKEQIQEQAYKQAINFSRELIGMQEAERKRIASELHDSLGQKLILIKNKILKASLHTNATAVKQDESLPGNVAEAIQEIRTISYGLRPYQIDLLGLTSSIRSLLEESLEAAGIGYKADVDNIDSVFDNEANINVYRIVQECVNNIIKHSKASHADISIKNTGEQVVLLIKDNGVGFNTSKSYGGFGLKGIKERLLILGGSIQIDSVPPHGTVFQFQIPVNNNSKQ